MNKSSQQAVDLLSISSEHRLRSENLAFDIDVWYPSIEQFTFPSVFLPFTIQEALAIWNYQNHRYRGKSKFNTDDIDILNALEERIDNTIKQRFPNGAFLRLCGRSPKDAEPLNRKGVVEKYEAELQKLLDAGAPLDANTKMRAISKVNWLKVNNGEEAMSLLLTSERVFADLNDWIRWGEPEQIVLREYCPELRLEHEFRAYVNNGKVNAISQYDHYCVYPNLLEMKNVLQQKILDYWKIVHPHIGEDSYVIDFAYLQESDRMIVIELSPFLPCTGPACFSWTHDRQQLDNGPLEFRLNTKNHPHLEQLVEANWEHRWQQRVPHYAVYYRGAKLSKRFLQHSWVKNLPLLTVPLGFFAHQQPQLRSIATVLGASLLTFSLGCSYVQNMPEKRHIMFFYGTLKRGFHWNKKFLERASFLCEATTVDPYPLVVGESGVPYLLGDLPNQGKQIRGELWLLDNITLQGLDEYEGVTKGYYDRRDITVSLYLRGSKQNGPSSLQVQAYFKKESSEVLRQGPFFEEYTLEFHKQNYKAIRHILVKQQMYLKDPSASQRT